jgi:putative CocE/NonD family hydrolase
VVAVSLKKSGWYDEAYGPEGAATNFNGLVASRRGGEAHTALILGPWVHGVGATARTRTGELEFGPEAAIDYDEVVLRWMDRYLRGVDNGVDREKPVRYFVMGENRWRQEDAWPPAADRVSFYLAALAESKRGALVSSEPLVEASSSLFVSDPDDPVTDPYAAFGPHDYSGLAGREDLLIFESEPLAESLEITGPISAEVFLSCDCRDTDLWVKLLEVTPDGTAFNLMSPGLDVQRLSYRDPEQGRALLEPGQIYRVRLDNLMTSNLFERGHRIRAQISATFFPRFSRNLHTGELETESARLQKATIKIHHDRNYPSRLILPVIRRGLPGQGPQM